MVETGAVHDREGLDTSSRREFVDYYAKESLSEATRERFETIRRKVLKLAGRNRSVSSPLRALDIGCGAGAQCILWASHGDRPYGIDINAELVRIARERAAAAGVQAQFDVGSAMALPYEDTSMDVCLMPELLEHVRDWEQCLGETVRVLRPGGVLYLSTTNRLCPLQQEFDLPLYSWYPAVAKRHFERLAATTRPDLVNYARYPAVHWFTYRELAEFLSRRGMICFDRFEMVESECLPPSRKMLIQAAQRSALLRFMGQVCTPNTGVFAIKR